MPGGIDYSKWDKMDYGDSSGDDGEGSSVGEGDTHKAMVASTTQPAAAGTGRPRVTRLEGPSRVTRDADGMITVDSTQPQASPISSASLNTTKKQPQLMKSSHSNLNQRLTKNGGQFTDEATQLQIFWSQDRQEVTIYIEFDATKIKSKDIRVSASGMVAYGERNAAVGGGETHGKLRVTAKVENGNGYTKILLEGELPHKIHLAEDEDEVEWEILSEDERKFVVVTLRKATPMAGVVIWWDCILKHCPKIELSGIEGRKKKSSDSSSGAGIESAWEEAHRLFKEKVKAGTLHQQHKVDIAAD